MKSSFSSILNGMNRGVDMEKDRETPEDRRERLRQEEIKRNPSSSIHGGGLPDLVGGLGWKGAGIVIIVLIVGGVVASIVMR